MRVESVMHTPRRADGFTLIELLVVIAIIAGLAAVTTPMIFNARKSGEKSEVQSAITQLALGIDSFMGAYGDYPPSSLEEFYETSGNGVDSGIESVVLCLASQRKGGPFHTFREQDLENLDGDSIDSAEAREQLDWFFGDDQLREFVDVWGNPLIYVHNNDYGDSFKITHERGGVMGTATASRSEEFGTFRSATSYQLWSSGPDGINENGAGDDLGSWE